MAWARFAPIPGRRRRSSMPALFRITLPSGVIASDCAAGGGVELAAGSAASPESEAVSVVTSPASAGGAGGEGRVRGPTPRLGERDALTAEPSRRRERADRGEREHAAGDARGLAENLRPDAALQPSHDFNELLAIHGPFAFKPCPRGSLPRDGRCPSRATSCP